MSLDFPKLLEVPMGSVALRALPRRVLAFLQVLSQALAPGEPQSHGVNGRESTPFREGHVSAGS